MTARNTMKIVCKKCGSDELYKFNAGGLLQARCRKCQCLQSIGPHNYVQVDEVVAIGPGGPQIVPVPTPSITHGEHIYEQDIDTGGFRDPRKQFGGEDEY